MASLDLPLHQTIIASTAAGVASTLLGHPIDTVKVHLQTNPTFARAQNKRPTAWAAAQHLWRSNSHSPAVFFRGIGPPLVNAAIMNVLTFAVFNEVKEGLLVGGAADDDDNGPGSSSSASYCASLAAGIVSGVASAFVSTPTDYVKIQAQLARPGSRMTSSSGAILEIMKLPNPSSILFRGHVANLCREGVFTCVYLGIYDVAMACVIKGDSATTATNLPQEHGRSGDRGGIATFTTIAAVSSVTGGLAWVVSYPFDTVKSVMQGRAPSKPRVSIPNAVRALYYNAASESSKSPPSARKKKGDLSAFYRGCAASTGRAVLVTSSRMLTYEFVARTFFRPASDSSDSHWRS